MKLTSTFIRALLLLMALTATIMPQELENITVLPFEGWTGSDSRSAGEFQNAITDKIITRIVQTHRFDVIYRANLEKIILEQDLHLTGLIDEASVVQIGKVLGVKKFILGTFTRNSTEHHAAEYYEGKKISDAYYSAQVEASIRMRAVETARYMEATEATGKGTGHDRRNALLNALDKLADAVMTRFEKYFVIQAYITSVDKAMVILDRGTAYGVKEGMDFDVYDITRTPGQPMPVEPEEEILKTYPSGEKQEVARYEWKGGERHIVSRTGYHSNGAVSFKETYQEGSVTSYRSWWPSGQLRVVREYEGGAIVSEVSYDSDGIRCLTGTEIELIRSGLEEYPGEPATPEDTVVMETSAGTIKLRLFTDVAPGHSNNFKRLANFGYYDSTTFHRVVPGFVIQGGDILSRDTQRANDGTGDPGYKISAEFNPRPHRKGTLALARQRDPNSAGSQFYIALRRLPQLDNQYTVFGEVIDGIAIVDSMAAASTDSRGNPVQPQRILRVRVGKSETP